MTPKIKMALQGVAILGGLLALGAYISAREDRVRMEATLDAQKAVQAEYQKQFNDLAKQMDARETAYHADLQSLQARWQSAQNPTEVAKLLSTVMGLSQPIAIKDTSPQSPHSLPQIVAQVPEVDFPQAKAYVQDCEECKLDRAKLTADAADRQAQAELAQKQVESLKTERDSAVNAAKGGNIWTRLHRNVKYILWGAVAGAAATCLSGHCK